MGKVFEYEEHIPNLFGTQPIKSISRAYLDEVDVVEDYCVLIQEMELDEEDTKKMVLELFTKMGIEELEFNNAIANAIFEVNGKNVFAYYYYPGIPVYIKRNKEVILENQNESLFRRDITIIELL